MSHMTDRRTGSHRAALIAVCVMLSATTGGQTLPSAELETIKIDFLLRCIESLNGAQFLRNGSSYSPDEAVSHLRLKWRAAGSRVVTARDFIREVASKSSVSGLAYSIRFSDGRVVTTADFLEQQLAAYEREH